MLANLQKSVIPDRIIIVQGIARLLADAKEDAYQLSMPLLVAAQLGHSELYQCSLLRIKNALSKMEKNSFTCWLFGRVLLAAKSMADITTSREMLGELKKLLHNVDKAPDEFIAWALGYLACFDEIEYQNIKEKMITAATHLTQVYRELNKSSEKEEQKQFARSNALWAWVISLQAAANVGDQALYSYSFEQIQSISQQKLMAEALLKGLLRTSASNDYPAWAMAIVRLAARTIHDEKLFLELQHPLKILIEGAEEMNAMPELLLAKMNDYLAIERQKGAYICN